MFDQRFIANLAVAARDVRFQLTLPWYFGIKKFHGEEYSPNPSEVEPQHLAANDTMTFHQTSRRRPSRCRWLGGRRRLRPRSVVMRMRGRSRS